MKRVGRSMFRMIYWFPLLGIVIVMVMASMFSAVVRGTILEPVGLFLLMSLSFVFWSWLIGGRWIAYYLVPLFVSTLTCPGCGEQIDAGRHDADLTVLVPDRPEFTPAFL